MFGSGMLSKHWTEAEPAIYGMAKRPRVPGAVGPPVANTLKSEYVVFQFCCPSLIAKANNCSRRSVMRGQV